VAYRPKSFWPSGTQVSIAANVYGQQVSPGLYGQADASISFTIGEKHVTIAKDNAPAAVNTVDVYFNDQLVNSFHTSMGKHSGEQVGSKWIDFHTMNGTYTVLGHENPAKMCSASYGLPANAPGGYPCESIYYATKISTDGIYLHQLNTTVWAQENGQDVSHGCLNLSLANAKWFFENSQIGDVVEISGTGGPTIEYWQGGAWSVPWDQWSAGGVA
jgi:lipoprotein-anchoring transpeptidase ErfK/SrfK